MLDARDRPELVALERADWMSDKERACVEKAALTFAFRCPLQPSFPTRTVGLVYGR